MAHRLEEKDRETISWRTSSTISVKDWIVEAPSDYGSTLLLLPSSFYFCFLFCDSNITFPMSHELFFPVLSPFFISSSSSPEDLLDKPSQGTEVSPGCAWDISSKRFFQFLSSISLLWRCCQAFCSPISKKHLFQRGSSGAALSTPCDFSCCLKPLTYLSTACAGPRGKVPVPACRCNLQ